MYLVSRTNTHRDVTDSVKHDQMPKIQKLKYLENRTLFFYNIKKFLLCASDDTFWDFSLFSLAVTQKNPEENTSYVKK